MQTFIDDLIPDAINAIAVKKEIRENQVDPNSKILGIYESYLSQFGPMANQIGMRSTIAVYYNKSSSGDGDRSIILKLIFNLLYPTYKSSLNNKDSFEDWIKAILSNSDINPSTEELILDASVALKRAIRTFVLTKKD